MMKKKILLTVYVFLLLFNRQTVSAQDFSCATDIIEQSMITTNPNYAQERTNLETFTQQYRNRSVSRMINMGCQQTAAIYYIPIVFHVMHLGETIGTGTNISESSIQNALAGMNSYFIYFGIQFVMAKQDASGNFTNGITRTNCSSVPNYVNNGIDVSTNNPIGAPDTTIKNLNKWDNTQYVNVWLVNKCVQNAAYAIMLGNYQGIVMYSNSFAGQSISSIFAHEMGHFMNLYHTFQGSTPTTCVANDDPYNQGDRCADTPPVKQADCASSSCGTFSNVNNSLMNMMGYCYPSNPIFTPDQKSRVTALLFSQYRWSLVSSPGLIPTNVTNEVAIDSIAFVQDLSQPVCNGVVTPQIQIKNYGNTVNSLELLVSIDNIDTTIIASPGFLRGSTNWLSLPSKTFSTSGSHSITVEVKKVNGVVDYNLFNNVQCMSFSVIVQTVTISTVMNNVNAGTINGSGIFSCNGVPDTIRVTTNPGYVFQNIKEGNTIVSTNPIVPLSINLSGGNRTFTAYHTIQTFAVSATANPSNGGRVVSGTGVYNYGSNPVVVFASKPGYQLVNVTLNGNIISNDSTIQLFALNADAVLVGNFALKTFTVSATTNPTNGGTVASGTGTFNYGAGTTVVFKAKAGYELTNVTENGNQISIDSNVTLSALNSNRILVANFALKKFSVNVSVNGIGGTASGGGLSITYGTSTTVTANNFSCWDFVGWYENNTLVSSSKSYTFLVYSTRNLVAKFTPKRYQIATTVNNAAWGTISDGDSYDCGSTVTVRAHVKQGARFKNLSDQYGTIISTDSVFLLQAEVNRLIIGNFELIPIRAGSDKTICFGESVTISASNADSYLWNTGQNTASITVSPTNTTTYIVTGANGTKDTVIVTVKPLPSVNFTKVVTGLQVQFSAPVGNSSYSWNFGDGNTSLQQNPLHTYTSNGIKTVTLNAALNGCSNSKTDTVSVNQVVTGIKNNITEVELNLYPNPTSSFLTIEVVSNDTYQISIIDLLGQTVWVSQEFTRKQIVDVASFARGTYVLIFDDGKGSITTRQFVIN